jgi:hypothetical protein
MVRTIISITEEDKAWLDRRAHQEGVTMTELVRRSIGLYRETAEPATSEFTAVLAQTVGLWQGVEGLTYQDELREEWGSSR